jgi:PAS domain S-box-containing protein
MKAISIPLIVIASISFYVGLYHLLIFFRRKQHREDFLFALMCFANGFYDVFCAGLYNSTSVAEGAQWQRLQFITLAFFNIAFVWFVSVYTHQKTQKLTYAFSIYFLFAVIIQVIDRSDLTWLVDRPAIKNMLLPFGMRVTYYEATLGLFTTVQGLMGLVIGIYILVFTLHFYKRGYKKEATPLIITLVILYATAINDTVISNGVYEFIYTIEYGYIALILLMAYSLSNTIVEATRTKESLIKSEERYRTIVENSQSGIFTVDYSYQFTYVNEQVCNILGYSREELIGKDLRLILDTESKEKVVDNYVRRQKGEPVTPRYEFNIIRKDGEKRILEMNTAAATIGQVLDITERKRAEEALFQAHLVVENSPAVLFRWGASEGWPVEIVSTNVTQFGYSPEELLSGAVRFSSLVHPQDLERVYREVQEYSSSGVDHFKQEYRLVTPNGEVRWVDDRTEIVRDSKGDIINYQGIVMDISERKRLEYETEERRQYLESIFASVPDAIVTSNIQHNIEEWNPGAERLFGYTAQEAVGKNINELITGGDGVIHREATNWTQVIQKGVSIPPTETIRYRKDGFPVSVIVSVSPIVIGEEWNGVVAVYTDIAERKRVEAALRESEEKYRSLFETSPESITLVGLHGIILDCNEATQHIAGKPIDQLIGKSFIELGVLNEKDFPKYLELFAKIMRGDPPNTLQVEYSLPDHQTRWVEVFPALLKKDDMAYAIQVISRDISENKKAEAERENLIKELETRNAELERFTYIVSHDLRSPLVTIRGFLGYLDKNVSLGNTDQVKADLNRIATATNKMQRMLNELLELSRIGRMMNPSEEISFSQLVKDAMDLVRMPIEARGIQVNIAANLPSVYGDRARLLEVLQNLIDNACKFMGDQLNPIIEIGTRGIDPDGIPVFFVRDNGIGIDPQFHERIFGLFNKLDIHTDGTGVGLALVKRIVEEHGGRIWVESQGKGAGSTFYFTLPANPGLSI